MLGQALVQPSVVKSYPANSLIIPMDVTYQNFGAFRAYGLVYKLLSSNVPVDWIIQPDKVYGAPDFTASALDYRLGTTITNYPYRGGPFVIHQANRAAADPIVQAWLAQNTSVNVHIAEAPFTANVARALVAAPRIAVFNDGNAAILFSYLNAAAIPDSQVNFWTTGSPDVLSPAAVAGATTANHRDGALFDSNGVPRFSVFVSGHQNAATVDLEAVAETGQFLMSRTMFVAQCQAVRSFENNGHFITDQGVTVGAQPATVDYFFSGHPIAQDDGGFGTIGGSDPSILPTSIYSGSLGVDYFRILRGQTSPNADVVLFGHAFQNAAGGRVMYLGGHQYSVSLPLSTNPSSHGTRYFLNAIFAAPSAGLAQLASAVSRKTHGTAGTFDITLPLTGAPGIECRSGGAGNDYQIVATWVEPVTLSGASVTAGAGSVSSTIGSGTNAITINLTGVANAQTVTVTLSGVSAGGPPSNIAVPLGLLVGDTTGNGTVNASDVGQTKAQSGQLVNGTNFRTDVNASGSISATDISLVKSQTGISLPPAPPTAKELTEK